MGGQSRNGSADRGQSYTLEGIVAGAVVLAAVAVALQSAVITPQSTSATSQRIEVVEGTTADTLLDHAARNRSLREAVLFWDPNESTFVNATHEGYVPGPPPNRFGRILNRTFSQENIAVNVHVTSSTQGGTRRTQMVFQGSPSNAAVTASRTVVLFNDDHLINESGQINTTLNDTISGPESFYAADAAPNSSVYNVVEVRLVVWRI